MVTVLEQGQVIATGTPAEIQHHPQVLQAYLGQQMPGAPDTPGSTPPGR